MRRRIEALSPFVANQIAAGEVIERPASVVKELLENAVDAGADSLTVSLQFGGLNQIKVSDNGHGIPAEELPLAIAPHATSKLQQLSDLSVLCSMGFRGEALASIASVSRLRVSSKTAEQADAMMLSSDEQGILVSPCARNQGTTVDVLDLFYNAPVRKSFLKSERVEYQAIETVVKRFALSAPEVAITLIHNGKQQLHLPCARSAEQRLARVKVMFGKLFVEQALYLNVTEQGMHLEGWISRIEHQRSQQDRQWIYLNKRMLKDKLMTHAIKQAYEGLLHPGRYPSCALFFCLPTEAVDVNVHPTKHEVRFLQPRLVHDFIRSNLSRVLVDASCVQDRLWKEKKPHSLLHTLQHAVSLPAPRWYALNSDFVLIFLRESPYLVDMKHLMQQQYTRLLCEQPLPWPSRPLLVPVTYTLSREMVAKIGTKPSLWVELGMQLDVVDETVVRVRSLPVALPSLDLSMFFNQLEACDELNKTTLLQCFTEALSCDVAQWDVQQRTEMIDYLDNLVANSPTSHGWRRLDREQCRALIYD